MGDHFCLKWNNHQENLTGIMTKLLDEQKFVDVSLVCEMKTFKAHQTVLSACSPYFEQVLEENTHPHPIIILRDVKESEMAALLQYMYRGEVSVRDDELSSFLHTARALKVRGLSETKKELLEPQLKDNIPQNLYVPLNEAGSPPKRQKTTGKGTEPDVLDKQIADSVQSQAISPLCKLGSKPLGGSLISQTIANYSDNSNEVHYSDMQIQRQTIKQEVDPISASMEEQSALPQHQQACIEPRNSQCHKLEEWNYDYGPNVENRHYQPQKAGNDGVNYPRNSGASSKGAFADSLAADFFERSKQWQIKYAFEKIEGSGFKCKICGQIKKHVRNHYLKHFPEHHECHLCRRTYTRKDNLNSHLKRDHFQSIKSSPDSYHRLKRLSKKLKYRGFKCLTPDVFSQIKYSSSLPVNIFGSHGSCFENDNSTIPGPMDLSFRPSSVPIQNHRTPIYDLLPPFYNYFQT